MSVVRGIGLTTLQSILNHLPMGVYLLDGERRVQWVTKGLRPPFNRKSASPSKECFRQILERRKPCNDCPALRALRSGKTESVELKTKYRGEIRHYFITATPIGRREQEPFLIVETVQDMTEPKKVDEDLRGLNEFNKAIIDNAPVSIFTLDRKGEFTSVNPALAELSGLGDKAAEKLVGFNWLKNPYTIRCGLAQYIRRGLKGEPFQLLDFPFTTYRGDRNQFINFNGVPLRRRDGRVEGLLCIIEETTEMVRTRAQLLQEAKMSVIGRLATGIAHELNNPLATITAHSELALESLENLNAHGLKHSEIGEVREYVKVIEDQAYRCTRTIRSILDLSRKEAFESTSIDIAGLLDDLIDLVSFKKMRIKLVKEVQEDLAEVKGDPNALRQAILNVISNAVDAVEGKQNAMIWVRARGLGDDSVLVEIEDNGTGIPSTMAELIFEPFFTTKEPRKGTGLGLTLCYDFLNRMGGSIGMEPRPGGGSIFKITLPFYTEAKGN
jgi:PAS domain S-box-containing protein